MSRLFPHVLIGVGITLAIWLLDDSGWPGLITGGVLAVALWMMLRLRPAPDGAPPGVPALGYLVTGVAGVALGYLMYLFGDGDGRGMWWGVGMILAGLLLPVSAVDRRT